MKRLPLQWRKTRPLKSPAQRSEKAARKGRVSGRTISPISRTNRPTSILQNNQLVTVPAGSLGTVPGLGPFPTQDTSINQGSQSTNSLRDTTLAQPLTQLPKIYQADKIALADQQIAAADLDKARTDVIFATHQALL